LLSLPSADLSSADFRPSLIWRLSLSITPRGVCAGASSPVQLVEMKPAKPLSTMVGRSGSSAMRLELVVASAREVCRFGSEKKVSTAVAACFGVIQ